MSDEINLGGKRYVSSKRAAQESGYAQDYIGQLARAGHIDAQRISGLWYVNVESLVNYKKDADEYVPQPPTKSEPSEKDSLVFFDGMEYLSAAKAAELTGYHPDYVSQLARSGAVMSRQIGNRWYVSRGGILGHKSDKDSLLAAVQAESVGIYKPAEVKKDEVVPIKRAEPSVSEQVGLTYTRDDRELLPVMPKWNVRDENPKSTHPPVDLRTRIRRDEQEYYEPRSIIHTADFAHPSPALRAPSQKGKRARRNWPIATIVTFAVAALVVGSIGLALMRGTPPQSPSNDSGTQVTSNSDGGALNKITAFLEQFLTKNLAYFRSH